MIQSKQIHLRLPKSNFICYVAVFDIDSQSKVRRVKGSKFFADQACEENELSIFWADGGENLTNPV